MKTTVRELGTIQLTSSLALALDHLQESLLSFLALLLMLSYLLCQGASRYDLHLRRQTPAQATTARITSSPPSVWQRLREKPEADNSSLLARPPGGLRGVLDKIWLSPAHPHFHEGKISARHSADPGGSRILSLPKTA